MADTADPQLPIAGANDSSTTPLIKEAAAQARKKKNKKKSKPRTDIPTSRVDTQLPLPANVKTQDLGKAQGNRGKCLVSSRRFNEGELVFREDAFVPNPPGQYVGQAVHGELCDSCFAPLSSVRAVRSCCSRKPACQSRWCSSACEEWGKRSHHALLCAGVNPQASKLLDLCAQNSWGAGFVSIRSLARLLQTYAKDPSHRPLSLYRAASADESTDAYTSRPQPAALATDLNPALANAEEVRNHLSSLATLSELSRRSNAAQDESLASTFTAQGTSIDTWRALLETALVLARAALHPDPDQRAAALQGTTESTVPLPKKSAANPAWWPLQAISPAIGEELLNFANLDKLVGRANVNMENHGSLYLVHSQLNHACEPNVSVRHLPPPLSSLRPATKVTIVATRTIETGEELVASYLGPSLLPAANAAPMEIMALIRVRRARLWAEYAFGPCSCIKCVADEAKLPEEMRARLQDELRSGEWKNVIG